MTQPSTVRAAIAGGLRFLESAQSSGGSFSSFSSATLRPFQTTQTYSTTFASSIILGAVSQLPDKAAKRVAGKAAAWLRTQGSAGWSYNYWAKDALQHTALPYPDDLDDTCCALLGLYWHDQRLVNGEVLGSFVRLLLACESRVGGPYYTWIAPGSQEKVWRDIDIAVNANVACFLQLVAEPLPHLTSLLEDALTTGKLASPYYPSIFPVLYYIARAYEGPLRPMLITRTLASAGRLAWQKSPLHTALALSTLVRAGYQGPAIAKARAYLLRTQDSAGSWPAEAFCLDPALAGQAHYAGSPALTTALVLEALHLSTPASATVSVKEQKAPTTIAADVMKGIEVRLSTLEGGLRGQGLALLTTMKQGISYKEIVLLPYFFARSLKQPPRVPRQLYVQLGQANMLGWMAYTIYDSFLDDAGQPVRLSAANVCMRDSILLFQQALPKHQAFQYHVRFTFNMIDAANTWEVLHCRWARKGRLLQVGALPSYGTLRRLAERSWGHTLTPLAILMAAHLSLDDPAVMQAQKALKHYLIARQLNDDMHDWEEDVQAGHISYVVTVIMRELALAPGPQAVSALLPRMRHQFWHHSLEIVCTEVRRHIKLSRIAWQRSGLLTGKNDMLALLDKLDATITHTLAQQADALDFLRSYQGDAKPNRVL